MKIGKGDQIRKIFNKPNNYKDNENPTKIKKNGDRNATDRSRMKGSRNERKQN